MDCKSMRAAAGRTCLSTMLQLFLGSVSFLYLSFLVSISPFSKQTFCDLQTHQSKPVQFKIPKLGIKLKLSKTQNIWGIIFYHT